VLVLTLDGSGDGLCATVNIGEKGKLKRIAETKSDASLGKVYSRVTFLLGMKPWEHEYKIMGLAPYAEQKGVEKSYRIIRPLVEIDEGNLVFRKGTHIWPGYCYPYLKSELENHRFDWIAGAAQKVVEELVVKWVNNAVKKTGIGRIACSGGVFMNVKANLLLTELKGLNGIFVVPSCGDESICIGAAYEVYAGHMHDTKKEFEIHLLDSIYLGPEFSQNDIQSSLDAAGAGKKYYVRFSEDINRIAARLLAAGEIVARFDGRMEWGARALGNRSILMDPKNTAKVGNLNAAIKCRDFWMPFAPTMLNEGQRRYIRNPKNIKSPHMMLGFHTTEKARVEFAAAVHPYDGTARPQILERKDNPGYYDLVKNFESISGIGGLLNTSFNIHGEPIVCTPEDAISTFKRSGLEYMILGNCLVSKKPLKPEKARQRC
ncbi:MAG: carbamoyltransferase C-terminal domain-containing protein, partial [Candidatus Omnitrophica bacterium]|nr:carbamoyltransferase C-terminal domain-containing protein [Candidatus Omnitrophota bacterium]